MPLPSPHAFGAVPDYGVTDTSKDNAKTHASDCLEVPGDLLNQVKADVIKLFSVTAAPSAICEGRLTTESGVPVSAADRTAQGTLYFTPFHGNRIALFDGTNWKLYAFTEKSISLAAIASGSNYDVYIYDNAGALTLELLVWTNDTTRATALVLQDGVYVKSGATTRRYLGTIRGSGAGTTEDSASKRFVWNVKNRVKRHLYARETTDAWSYTTAAFRELNGGGSYGISRVGAVFGLSEDLVTIDAYIPMVGGTGVADRYALGVAVDDGTPSPPVNVAKSFGGYFVSTATAIQNSAAKYNGIAPLGFKVFRCIESSNGGAMSIYGDNGYPAVVQQGMVMEAKF